MSLRVLAHRPSRMKRQTRGECRNSNSTPEGLVDLSTTEDACGASVAEGEKLKSSMPE